MKLVRYFVSREYLFSVLKSKKIYRRRMVWLLLHPHPAHLPSVGISLSQSSGVSPVELTDGRGGRVGGGRSKKAYDDEKAWSSIPVIH
jgi:hypothetical protein